METAKSDTDLRALVLVTWIEEGVSALVLTGYTEEQAIKARDKAQRNKFVKKVLLLEVDGHIRQAKVCI